MSVAGCGGRSAGYRPLGLLLAVTLVTCSLGWLFKGHCIVDGNWDGFEQYTTGCYTDAAPFWFGHNLAAGAIPYFQTPIEYPVLTGALIYLDAMLTRLLFGAQADAPYFVLMVSLINTALALLTTALLWRIGVSARRLWMWAAAPALILYVGHNWDMLAVALTIGALSLAQRARLDWAAILSGLGAAAKLFSLYLLPLLVLPALLRRRIGEAIRIGAFGVAAWLLVNLPVAILAFGNWSQFYTFSSTRAGTPASVWELLGSFGWFSTSVPERNLLSGALFVIGGTAIVAFGWRNHRSHLWALITPVVAWFLLVNKVYSPQFDLWVYPLMLATAPRLLPVAIFAIADVLAYFAEFWFLAGLSHAWPADDQRAILAAASIRGVAMIWIIVTAVRRPAPAWIDGGSTSASPAVQSFASP